MKRITITLLSFFIATSLAHASIFNVGPRIGLSVSELKVDQVKDKSVYEALNPKAGLGYHLGAFARFSFGAIYMQPELLISGSGAQFNDEFKQKQKIRFTKLDVPVMMGLSFFNTVRAQVGPSFNILLDAVAGNTSVKDCYSTATIGWQAGLGIDLFNMVFDIKYEGNLTKFGKQIGGFKTKQGYGLWALSVGFNAF